MALSKWCLLLLFFAASSVLVAEDQVNRVDSVLITEVKFVKTPVREATKYLVDQVRGMELHDSAASLKNVVLVGDFGEKKITLELRELPVLEVFKVMAALVDANLKVLPEVIVIYRGDWKTTVFHDEGSEALAERMQQIRIPKIDFHETSIRDAIEFLNTDPTGESAKRINLALKDGKPAMVTCSLEAVSFYTALEILVRVSGHQMIIGQHLVFVGPDGT